MATVAALTAELSTIEAQMARPKAVQFGDRSETQRSMEELTQRRNQILSELSRAQGRRRTFYAHSSKGLG